MASKKPASKKKVKIADLPKPAEELTPARARAVRGGLRTPGGGSGETTDKADIATAPLEDMTIER